MKPALALMSVFVFALLLPACGSDTINITLLTPIPVANPTQNLSNTLIQRVGNSNAMVSTLAGPACRQMELRAGFKAPGWNSPLIPVSLSSELLDYNEYALGNNSTDFPSRTTPPISGVLSATDYLNTKSALRRPIVIPVPKGVEGELFLIGTVMEPITKDSAGVIMNATDGAICKDRDSSLNAIKSFAIYGVEPFRTTEVGTKALRPNVLQTVKPYDSTSPIVSSPYNIPVLASPVDDANSDFKCRNLNDRRTCPNRYLFEMKLLTSINTQVWVRYPPPPNDSIISMRLGMESNAFDSTWFYFPRESPFLITYQSGGTFNVLVQYFQRTITYSTPGGRVTQQLVDCTSLGRGWVGNVPTSPAPSPSPSIGCSINNVPQDFNFSIKDLGEGFN